MSINIKSYIKFVAFSMMMVLMGSCTEEVHSPSSISAAEEDVITITLFQEGANMATRADGTNSSTISDGSKVNRLYYAIYRTIDPEEEIDPAIKTYPDKDDEKEVYILDTYYHRDENKKYKEQEYTEQQKKKGLTIKLVPENGVPEGRKYKILCWAQYTELPDNDNKPESGNEGGSGSEGESGTEETYISPYYTFENGELTSITVKYEDALNNDEGRDAFYASQKFTPDDKGTISEVYLRRPFAQINVGTSGWDVEGLAMVEPERYVVKYSQIKITNLATKFDLFNKEVKKEGLEAYTFDFNTIPAYRHLAEQENIDFDSLTPAELSGIYETDHDLERDYQGNIVNDNGLFIEQEHCDEEFLLIDFPKDDRPKDPEHAGNYAGKDNAPGSYSDYIGWDEYDGFCATSKTHDQLLYDIYTETFKYLSMSYVLVPFEIIKDKDGNETGVTRSTVDVVFDCSKDKNNGGLYNPNAVIELKNVPVCSNHRTNIIAADGTGFFMNSNELYVAIYSQSFADYYKSSEAEDQNWDDTQHGGSYGDNTNGEYQWPSDDIEPIKSLPVPTFKSFEIGEGVYWHPLLETLDINFSINPLKDINTGDYHYIINIHLDEDISFEGEWDNGNYNVSIPTYVLDKIYDRENHRVECSIEAISDDISKYKNSDRSEKQNITLKWNTSKVYKWNFQNRTDDNLNGQDFLDNMGNKVNQVVNDYTWDTCYGLTASVTNGSQKIIAQGTDKDREISLGNSSRSCNLNFILYSSCQIKIGRTSSNTTRTLVIDYFGDQHTDSNPNPEGKHTFKTQTSQWYQLSYELLREDKKIYIYSGGSGINLWYISLKHPSNN